MKSENRNEKTCRIAAIPGDGIGKEVLPEGIRVLQAAAQRWDLSLSFEQMEWASCEYYAHHGKMMPDDWREQLRGLRCYLLRRRRLAGYRSRPHFAVGSLLKFRREFDQYVNLRPVRLFPGVPCPLAGKRPAISILRGARKYRRRIFRPRRPRQ